MCREPGHQASGTVLKTLYNSQADSWNCKVKLFESIISTTLLYASHICYLERLEIVQSNFYKKLLGLSNCAPNFALRLDLNLVKIAYRVLYMALNWVETLLASEPTRFAKVCLLRQVAKHKDRMLNDIQNKYN